MAQNARGRRQGAPAAALLSPDKAEAPVVIDAAKHVTDEEPEAAEPLAIGQATRDEHEARQRELREHQAWLAQMAGQTPGEMVEAEQDAPEAEPEPVETYTQQLVRLRQECLERYWLDVAAMPDTEPVYVVGLRPPRPQCYGIALELGDVVPGAARWPRLDSWLRAGVVVPAAQGVKSA